WSTTSRWVSSVCCCVCSLTRLLALQSPQQTCS
ncbi:PTS system, mannitol-specific IIC component family protein, partial [Vibrio parahaemolyticus V-223/04]